MVRMRGIDWGWDEQESLSASGPATPSHFKWHLDKLESQRKGLKEMPRLLRRQAMVPHPWRLGWREGWRWWGWMASWWRLLLRGRRSSSVGCSDWQNRMKIVIYVPDTNARTLAQRTMHPALHKYPIMHTYCGLMRMCNVVHCELLEG